MNHFMRTCAHSYALSALIMGLGGAVAPPAVASTYAADPGFCGTAITNSPIPIAPVSVSCTSDVTSYQGTATATVGHLGVKMVVAETIGGVVSPAAVWQIDDLVLSGPDPTVPLSLNLAVNGNLTASDRADVLWRILGTGAFTFDHLTQVGADPNHPVSPPPRIGFKSGGETIKGGSDVVSGTMTTDMVVLPTNTRLSFSVQLSVAGFGTPGTFAGDFLNGVDLPVRSDVFDLPAGFTANAASVGIVDNRFVTASVREPSIWELALAGLAALAATARRPARSAAVQGAARPLERPVTRGR